jgi:hypothetical protein
MNLGNTRRPVLILGLVYILLSIWINLGQEDGLQSKNTTAMP